MKLYDRDFILSQLTAMQEQRRLVISILFDMDQRMEEIENFVYNQDKLANPFHYDTMCNCDDCECQRNTYRVMVEDDVDIMDDASYRMD
jgi:hypothetical protein